MTKFVMPQNEMYGDPNAERDAGKSPALAACCRSHSMQCPAMIIRSHVKSHVEAILETLVINGEEAEGMGIGGILYAVESSEVYEKKKEYKSRG